MNCYFFLNYEISKIVYFFESILYIIENINFFIIINKIMKKKFN